MLWTVAAITMVVAAVLTVVQSNVKRLLGYSSVANVGFLLLGVSAHQAGASSTMFYLVTYGISTLGAFTVAGVVAVFLIAAALACVVPARRALRVDPMIALRAE